MSGAKGSPQAAAGDAPAKKSRTLLVLVGLVVLAAAGGGWFAALRVLGGEPAPAAQVVEPPLRATMPVGALVVNVAGDARRYLRVTVHLGVPGPKDVKELEEARPQVTDLLLSLLARADLEGLLSEERREQLKSDIVARLREDLGLGRVGAVYFTEFVVQ
jgi:flagellar protein FliL